MLFAPEDVPDLMPPVTHVMIEAHSLVCALLVFTPAAAPHNHYES
jgi:hypothetical protein